MDYKLYSDELDELIGKFEKLSDVRKLEFINVIFEKLANAEILIEGKAINPKDINIDNPYDCMAAICNLIDTHENSR